MGLFYSGKVPGANSRRKTTWAPHYTIHKTLMGLVDACRYAGNEEALAILKQAANWFYRWTGQFNREQMDDILDFETGGMLEVWADLYGFTGEASHLELLQRYTLHRLFEQLLAGKDVLTNMHANTSIPKVLGAARAYEVTGDERWLNIVEAYWKWAVDERGYFCTGGQTSGAIWTPPFEFAARRGDKNQEHCTVYNMIRLADFLFRQTGDPKYTDYSERNLYNGILAQQNGRTGMITYFLPLEAGGRKRWGSPTNDFWCCHGSLVQAHTLHNAYIFYRGDRAVTVAQYIPSQLETELNSVPVSLELERESNGSIAAADDNASSAGSPHRPKCWTVRLKISCEQPHEFSLQLRLPWWMQGQAILTLNREAQQVEGTAPGFCKITHTWHNDTLTLVLPKGLAVSPIPDEPETVAFLDGPVVLAGLCDKEVRLSGDKNKPENILVADNERQWRDWLPGYRTVGQPYSIRFKPLYEVEDEIYSVYFPLTSDDLA
ncbi:MAG TPA: beta-L-arabinofuranosidase domain-containing protein [Chloroflexia bacterium]|nr:beta-L-arabinofuranosidase domain-containing protein [Chloroflexia bacterium]